MVKLFLDYNEDEMKIHPEEPKKATVGSSGYDIIYPGYDYTLKPGETKLFKTGIKLEMLPFFEAQIRSRSGLSLKHSIAVLNAPGTIDSDYRGDVGVILHNFGDKDFVVETGMRIAQLVFCKIERVIFETAKNEKMLNRSQRDDGGFGHTGLL